VTIREGVAVIFAALDQALADLDRYARDIPFDRLVADRDAFRMVSNALFVAAQAAIDLGEVLLKERGAAPAASYREVFTELAKVGAIPLELAKQLDGWAGFRNLLAHLYTKLDLERIHLAYTTELDALREFRRVATAALGETQPG
jgi:uncharacterized protein YutE (UPF0331/DUF86 family)